MYEAFYGLKEKPFNLTPDPRFLYLSEKHKEAFAHLLFGIKNRTGFVMVSGEIGTGKTTICRTLLNRLDPDTEVAFIFNPCLSPVELLRKINEDFGIRTQGETVKDLIDELNQYLLDRFSQGKNCVLVIDEAQNLAPGVLEQIRLLSNLETETQKLLQIVLIGQPELMRSLSLPELRQLDQRITARYHLKSLDRGETLQYIAYRLRVAGGRGRVWFTERALKQIYRASGGIPRVINAICDRALLIGYTQESRDITSGIVRQAVREIRGERARDDRPSLWASLVRRYAPSPTVVAAGVLIILFGKYVAAPVADRFGLDAVSFGGAGGSSTRSSGVGDLLVPSPVSATIPSEDVQPDWADSAGPTPPAEAHAGLDALTPEIARNAAAISLLRLWQQALISDYPKSDSPESLLAFAAENGLQCEPLNASIAQLEALNLPAFVRLAGARHIIWAGLLEMDEDHARIASGPMETLTIAREELERRYLNQAVVIWRDPAPKSPVLRLVEKGPAVEALQRNLQRLGRLSVAPTGVYGSETAAAITAIQAETGLRQDGIAGRQVRMVLSSWMNTPGVPHLRPQQQMYSAATASAGAVVEPSRSAPQDAMDGGGVVPEATSTDLEEEPGEPDLTESPPQPPVETETEAEAEAEIQTFPESSAVENQEENVSEQENPAEMTDEEKPITPASVSGMPLVPHGSSSEKTEDMKVSLE